MFVAVWPWLQVSVCERHFIWLYTMTPANDALSDRATFMRKAAHYG